MRRSKELYVMVLDKIQEVYSGTGTNVTSTEWCDSTITYDGKKTQTLTVAGTDELIDWFWNMMIFYWDGVKIGNYLAAHMVMYNTWGDFEWLRPSAHWVVDKFASVKRYIFKDYNKYLDPPKPFTRIPGTELVIGGHSKSGPTVTYIKRKWFKDDETVTCLAWCPARGHRDEEELDNTVLIIDPNDLVPKVGWSMFHLPKTKLPIISLPNDKVLFSIKDHLLSNVRIAMDDMDDSVFEV